MLKLSAEKEEEDSLVKRARQKGGFGAGDGEAGCTEEGPEVGDFEGLRVALEFDCGGVGDGVCVCGTCGIGGAVGWGMVVVVEEEGGLVGTCLRKVAAF